MCVFTGCGRAYWQTLGFNIFSFFWLPDLVEVTSFLRASVTSPVKAEPSDLLHRFCVEMGRNQHLS